MERTPAIDRASQRLAAVLVRWRYAVVAAWAAAAVVATVALPGLDEAEAAPLGGLVPRDSAAIRTSERSAELFRFPVLADTAVVQRDPDGLPLASQARVFARAIEASRDPDPDAEGILLALPVTNSFELFPASRERSTTAVTYLFVAPDRTLRNRYDLAHLYGARYLSEPGDALVGVTGVVPAQIEQFAAIGEALSRVELATVLALALVVGLTFRSPGAPLLALAAAGAAYFVAIRVIALAGEVAGVSVPREVEPLVVVLLLGIVTDYAIFYLSDFRRRVAAGAAGREAARAAAASTTPIVVTAGLIVAAGSAALLAGTLDFFRAFGPGLALTALIGMLASVTLVPALLAVSGPLLFWPGVRAAGPPPEGRAARALAGTGRRVRRTGARVRAGARESGARLTRIALARPVVTLAAGAALLGAAASGLAGTSLGLTLIRGLPEGSEVRRAAAAASQGFAAGILSPTEIVVERPGVAGETIALARLQFLLELQPGVAAVIGPRDNPTRRVFGAVLSPTGDAARYLVVLDSGPLGAQAIEDIRGLGRRLPALLSGSRLAGAEAGVTGATALAAETVASTVSDLRRIAVAAALVNLVLLALFLRSLVAPLYLLATSLLALAAALGLTSWVFEDALGYGELTYYVPFVAAALLLSLGSDYNVFVVGRIWHAARGAPLVDAARREAPRAASAIAAAGIALAAGFALLALVPLRPFRELAFVLSTGVLIETFVVRSLLVPALIAVFGDLGLWPRRRPARIAGGADAGGPRG